MKTAEEFMFTWLTDYALCGPWTTEEVTKFAKDYNTYVQTEEEKWFDNKDNNVIEDLMKKVEKYILKGSVIVIREIVKKQGLQLPKHKRK